MPINSRTKGAAGERDFAKALLDELGVKLERNLQQARNGGHDLIVVGDCPIAQRLNRYAIEVKRYRQPTDGLISDWWQQTTRQAEECGKSPLLAYRGDKRKWRVIISMREFSPALADKYPAVSQTAWLSIPAFGAFIRETNLQEAA